MTKRSRSESAKTKQPAKGTARAKRLEAKRAPLPDTLRSEMIGTIVRLIAQGAYAIAARSLYALELAEDGHEAPRGQPDVADWISSRGRFEARNAKFAAKIRATEPK